MADCTDTILALPKGSKVLVAGAGGGWDIVAGLPVAIALRQAGHDVHLANYCVGMVDDAQGAERPLEQLYRIDETCQDPKDNRSFPEGSLSRWWQQAFNESRPVWCFARKGGRPVAEAYQYLAEHLQLDAVCLVDGGVDGLFIGDEHDCSTPSMDAISIVAANTLTSCKRFFTITAFGTEGAAYSVRHADVLYRISEQIYKGGMLGVSATLSSTHVGKQFLKAVETINEDFPNLWHSIIVSSIVSAMKGHFGERNLTPRTDWAPVWVSPLTLLCWYFDLKSVAEAKPNRDEVLQTETVAEVVEIFEETRKRLGKRARTDIPI